MTWKIVIPHGALIEVRGNALTVTHHFGRYSYRVLGATGFSFGEIGSIGRTVSAVYD